MKIVLVLIAVLVGVWLFRSSRRASRNPTKPERSSANPAVAQLEMVRCLHCDLHLPKSDAVTGRRGIYCSLEHRQSAES
jgi:uncharacterized protein